jgi:tRNA(His) 5'-end guanylyltransferase
LLQENMLWRSADCMRNSVNNLGRSYYSARQLHRKSNGAVLEQLRSEHNVEWNDYPDHFKHGILLKKRLAERHGVNQLTGCVVHHARALSCAHQIYRRAHHGASSR